MYCSPCPNPPICHFSQPIIKWILDWNIPKFVAKLFETYNYQFWYFQKGAPWRSGAICLLSYTCHIHSIVHQKFDIVHKVAYMAYNVYDTDWQSDDKLRNGLYTSSIVNNMYVHCQKHLRDKTIKWIRYYSNVWMTLK